MTMSNHGTNNRRISATLVAVVALAAAGAAGWMMLGGTTDAETASASSPVVDGQKSPGAMGGETAERETQDALAKRAQVASLQTLRELQKTFQDSQDDALLEEALTGAARLGTEDATRWLAHVAGTDSKYGGRAGAALGQMASADAAGTLESLALGQGPVIVRANAAKALGASGSGAHVPSLVQLVRNDAEALRVRQEGALALGRLKAGGSVDALAAALEAASASQGPDAEQLRISLVRALAMIGTEPARAAVARHAQRPLSSNEQVFVTQALAAR